MAEVWVDNIHCSPFIYTDCHILIEGCQIIKHDFPLVDACWIFPSTFVSLTCLMMTSVMSCSITFPRIVARLTALYFPGSSFSPFFEDWSDINFPPVFRQVPCTLWPFKDDGMWLSNNICHFPQHLWVYPISTQWHHCQCQFCTNDLETPWARESLLFSRFSCFQGLGFLAVGLAVKSEEKKAFSNCTFSVSSIIRAPISFISRPLFSHLPFATVVFEEVLSVVHDIAWKI